LLDAPTRSSGSMRLRLAKAGSPGNDLRRQGFGSASTVTYVAVTCGRRRPVKVDGQAASLSRGSPHDQDARRIRPSCVASASFGQDAAPRPGGARTAAAAPASPPPPKPATSACSSTRRRPGRGKAGAGRERVLPVGRGQTGIDPTAAPRRQPPLRRRRAARSRARPWNARGAAVGAVSDERHIGTRAVSMPEKAPRPAPQPCRQGRRAQKKAPSRPRRRRSRRPDPGRQQKDTFKKAWRACLEGAATASSRAGRRGSEGKSAVSRSAAAGAARARTGERGVSRRRNARRRWPAAIDSSRHAPGGKGGREVDA